MKQNEKDRSVASSGDAMDSQERKFSATAQRALAEARQRREAADHSESRQKEIGGRGGKDPARYGDWEVKGIAVDF